MGTYMAGASIVTRVTQLITLMVGTFLWAYAAMFQPPAGDIVEWPCGAERLQNEVATVIHNAHWSYPQSNVPVPLSNISVSAWYATGLKLDSGRCWEIRLADPESKKFERWAEKLEKESSPGDPRGNVT